MSSSFGSIDFDVRYNAIHPSRSSEMTVLHIPGSNNNFIDIGGSTPLTLNYDIFLASLADYDSLDALRGQTYTLNCPNGSGLTAALTNLSLTGMMGTTVIASVGFVVV